MKKHLLLLMLFLSVLAQCSGLKPLFIGTKDQRDDVPKNVILFIGDGMGVSHITAGKVVKGTLNLERFKIAGFLTTHAHDAFVTDSAASTTALATGCKTNIHSVAICPDKKPLQTVLELAEQREKSTGIVVTCSVTHATPAAFLSHVDSRNKEELIAEQISGSGVDVLFGGGWAYFVPDSVEGSKRADAKDLIAELEKHMKVVFSVEEFRKLDNCRSVAAFFAQQALPEAKKRGICLAEMTEKAIHILSQNNKGFFLMVEGSQIDWGGHKNDQEYIVTEIIDFDNAVGAGLDFAEADGNTLVIVTSDHETGGFAIHDGSVENNEIISTGFTTRDHTATMVPLFAYGPGSAAFGGIQDNTVVGKTIIQYLSDIYHTKKDKTPDR